MSRRILRAVAEIFISGIGELKSSHIHTYSGSYTAKYMAESIRTRLLSIYYAYVLYETFCNFVGIRQTDYRDYIQRITEHARLISAADRTLKNKELRSYICLRLWDTTNFVNGTKTIEIVGVTLLVLSHRKINLIPRIVLQCVNTTRFVTSKRQVITKLPLLLPWSLSTATGYGYSRTGRAEEVKKQCFMRIKEVETMQMPNVTKLISTPRE